MMAFSYGDTFPCVVGEVGSYATKMGFAGEDHPRSYFRSTTAILRDSSSKNEAGTNSKNESTHGYVKKFKRSYDFFSKPLSFDSSDDIGWEVVNPMDRSTGLIYDPPDGAPSSMNSNTTNHPQKEDVIMGENGLLPQESEFSGRNGGVEEEKSVGPPTKSPGECYSHFSDYLTHGYESALCTEASSAPLLLVERSYNPPPIRQKMMEIAFEQQNVPATFFARDAVCACYAVGRTTGTVVDIGYNGTVVSPVFDGFVETKGILRSPVGTAMMDEMILSQLDSLYKTKKARMKLDSPVDYVMPVYQVQSKNKVPRQEPFHTFSRLDIARFSREDGTGGGVGIFGYSSLHDLEGEEAEKGPNDLYQQYANAPKASYRLPDGTTVEISQTKRFDVAELMFGKGGKNAKLRNDMVTKLSSNLENRINFGGDSANADPESSAIAQLEELRRRKRNAKFGGQTKYQSSNVSYEKLVKACRPYLSSTIGELSSGTIPSMICDSAFKCDRDQQGQLLGNVVLCGGGACLSKSILPSSRSDSMPERIRKECEHLIHTHTPGWRVKVLSPGVPERAICSWLGASILGSLGSFHEMWISKAEYEEHGAAIINRKCP